MMGVFDEMAGRYDRPERVETAKVIAEALRRRLTAEGGGHAIDYGCGTGLVGLPLAGCFQRLLMVDASRQMIEVVREKIRRMRLENVDTLCADFTAEEPKGLLADTLFMAQVLLHIPDTEGILRRIFALLRPGGRLLIVDFDKDEGIAHDKVHNGFVQARLIEMLEAIGFAGARAETFYQGKNLFMNRDASMFILEAVR